MILGIDIGGTKTIVGVADASGALIVHNRVETPYSLGPDRNIAAIKKAAREVIERSGRRIELIGIGCGGPMDRKAGVLHKVANLPGWEGLCVTSVFGDEFGAPAYLENDQTAACIGEYYYGAGRGIDDFCYFGVSTGIGGGIIAGGKVYRGYGDNAAEFGHQKILPDGPQCACGDRGCLESLSSGPSIARRALERLSEPRKSILREWSKGSKITAEMVARAVRFGDELASEVWFEAMGYLGLAVVNVISILNPRRVVIGGGVAKAGNLLFEPVRRAVAERALPTLGRMVDIVPAENGDLAGLLGTFAIAMEQTLRPGNLL